MKEIEAKGSRVEYSTPLIDGSESDNFEGIRISVQVFQHVRYFQLFLPKNILICRALFNEESETY